MNNILFLKISYFLKYLLNLKIKYRKIYFIAADLSILTFSFFLSLWILDLNKNINYSNFLLFIVLASFYLIFGNYYKLLTRYTSSFGLYKLAQKNSLLIISLQLIFYILKILYPFKFWVVLFLISNLFTIAARVFLRDLINIFNIFQYNVISYFDKKFK